MTGWKDKLNSFIEKKQKQVQRGREVTEQMKAERIRKKQNRLINAKPGAVTAIRTGLVTHASPLDVMKEEYNRRKYERDNK
jgi:hypothetical protein